MSNTAHNDLVNMHAKIAKQRTIAKLDLEQLQMDQETLRQLRAHLGGAITASTARADQDQSTCCAKCRKAVPVVLGITNSLATLAQLGLKTAGTIKGDPTLGEAAQILGESQTLLNAMGEQVIQSQNATDLIKVASNATAGALKISGGATGNNQLNQIGDAVLSGGTIFAGIGQATSAQDAIKTLTDTATDALNHASQITGNQKLVTISQTIQKAGVVLSNVHSSPISSKGDDGGDDVGGGNPKGLD